MGLSGQAIMENGKVKNLKYISSVNIRVAHEMIGCADAVFLYCMQPGVVSYINRITAGMWKDHDVKRFDPSDIGRKFPDSGACGRVVDERSEIGTLYGRGTESSGNPDGYSDARPKAEGNDHADPFNRDRR